MEEVIDQIRHQVTQDLQSVNTTSDVEALKVKYLGRKGPIQALFKQLRDVSAETRPQVGHLINNLRDQVSTQCEELIERFCITEQEQRIAQEHIDITLPGRRQNLGRRHPVNTMLQEALDILTSLGFSVQMGPDIDTEYYNFESLNFPADHPAKDMQDTFYISKDHLLRTQTTNIQVRLMEQMKPPIRVVCPGKCYRNETITARSHVQFHQIDGFAVDKGITFRDLIFTLKEFFKRLFNKDLATRFRPSYFPFVEPGMEVDVECLVCGGDGCSICKHSGWLEVLGRGMVHPQVLKNGGVDPEVYSGYAWGMGIERLLMIQRGIKDIRLFMENDRRFLNQFT